MDNYDTEIRPLLAEFCGYRKGQIYLENQLWIDPRGFESSHYPDPLRSHSDCHALIAALWDRTETKVTTYFDEGHCVEFARDDVELDLPIWTGLDYREGVVTLAAPIAREARLDEDGCKPGEADLTDQFMDQGQ